MKRLCVFCGSSPGARPAYLEAARNLGRTLLGHGMGLVYGGASIGMMGAVAETVLDGGGEVIGVMPEALVRKEVAFGRLTDLRVVKSMHERKGLMVKLSDGFVALPGGLGTVEEFMEVLTWSQLGMHQKPCAVLDVEGYYTPLVRLLEHMAAEQFIERGDVQRVIADADPESLIARCLRYQPPATDKAAWALALNGR
jgi:uncharacterized protein (TIGR00730 family)